ncbi:PREDICTED: transforming growth factor-beta receptor-associated protein 1 isoform X1 [Prunus mume]|uniref:Transforming growth factor-beta receptor-associated protein 1 isoform X1 n=1 Tax=Prunus mume TaxID=102107 RepID=A0ABM0NJI7_PRUMU|nr:PREDICTED: transforming growth factor-beta receptor-associated protein 1 isoform X1 [Prunus mume]XP_008225719.1 PREDICTED: transforming growth factor-beta receptor-associated protein 1 isoform X1 [Prunus mume]
MAKPELSARTVLEPLSFFNLSDHSRAQVTSLAIYTVSDSQCLIYIGTQFGALFLFSVNPGNPNDETRSDRSNSPSVLQNISLLRKVVVGNSSVESIQVFGDIGKLLVLLGGFLFTVDSLLLQPVKRLSFLRGISVITRRLRSSESECSNLSALSSSSEYTSTSQRFLQKLGSGIRANGLKMKETVQQRVDNHVFSVVIGKRLVLIELVLINRLGKSDQDIDDGSFVILKEIQCIDGVMAMVWLNDSIIVSTVNGYSLFSCVTGQSGVIFSLPDGSSLPRLKLLCKEWNLLLLVDNVGIIANAHGQPVGGSLVFHSNPDSIGEITSYVVVARDGKLELYHKKTGTCIQMVTFGGEGVGGPCVVADEEDRTGNLVVVATPTKVVCFRKLPSEEQIKDLLRKKNFKEAISLVEELECEGELSKDMLSFVHAQVGFLLLFDLHFEEAVNHFLQSEAMQPSEVFPFIMRDPNRWSLLVPRNRYWGLHPPPAPLEDVVDDGLLAIQRAIFLRKAGVETVVDDAFLLNPPSRDNLLESAIKSITRYLEVSREKELTPSVKEGVDTLLMYLYRALNNVYDMEKLASSANSCVVEELETLLDDSGHLRTLAFLYASKGMSSKALGIWRILARHYSSGLWKDPVMESGSQDGGTNIVSGKETAAAEASKLLEESSDPGLVLQHLGWVADINQVFAVQVLTSEKRVNQLPPDEVIAAIDPKKVEIFQRYLQWLIEDQESYDSQFHTLYALSLAKSAIEAFQAEIASQNLDPGRIEETNISDHRTSLIFQSPVRERLQIFLEASDLYDPEEVLDLIEGSELWSEKAILYKKLGQEALVLQILALKLENSEAAEQYCAEIGRPDVYMQLLDMYLDPQDGKEPMFKAAVRLLHNHGESLDPLQVLERLSPDMPLQLASETILRMLRARLHHYRQGRIVHNLSRALDTDASLAILEEKSRHVQINDESLCDSCHARLGTKLFAMYPDDTVVCYKCFRRQGESTSVTGRNFKQDVLVKPGWLVTR